MMVENMETTIFITPSHMETKEKINSKKGGKSVKQKKR